MHDATGLRDRKRAYAHRAIARAALRLATERGPDAVTVADIAAAADVSPRTVFNHFETKDHAILGRDPGRGRALREAIEAQPGDLDPVDAVVAVFLAGISDADDLGASWGQRAELVHRYPSLLPAQLAGMAEVETEVALAIANRSGADADRDLFPRLAAAVCLTAVRTTISHGVATGADDLAGAVRSSLEAVAVGLRR